MCVGGGAEERESGGVVGERREWERDEEREEREGVKKVHCVLEIWKGEAGRD